MGTLVRDAQAATLYTAQSVAADDDGDSVEVNYPLDVASAEITVTTDITGDGAAAVVIEGSEDDTNFIVVSASSLQVGAEADDVFVLPLYAPFRYVRARIAADGTVAGNVTVTLEQDHIGRINPHPGANGSATAAGAE